MKKTGFILTTIIFMLAACNNNETTSKVFKDSSVSLGGNLVYDVFYSFEQGEIARVKRSDWDICFSVPLQTAAIRINEGSGVELFNAGSKNDWENPIISGGRNVTQKLWNEKSDWHVGAFNRYTDPDEVFNYSWGTYNHGTTYNVDGDSIYIIKLTDGSQKKLFVEKRDGYDNYYKLKWANIDGSNPDSAQVDMTISNKNFVYFSILDNSVIEYEPDADTWDLLFTVYKEKIPAGTSYIDYNVMGILTNLGYTTGKVEDKNPVDACDCDAGTFIETADAIGWDWKTFDNNTQEYTVTSNLSYFVKNTDGKIYQVYFTDFEGSKSGIVSFNFASIR